MGVVGAGGAGFPTYVKAGSTVEYVLANGAECEPLVHKDVELMKHFAPQIVEGVRAMMRFSGATRGRIGVKEKNKRAVEALRGQLGGDGVDLVLLGDFYPSGDEYELVYLATGRLIPPAGIPLQVGCIVNNVETLYNVQRALDGHPVVDKFVSVTGAVNQPCSMWVPLGTPFRELIERAGGASIRDFAVFASGLMMGRLAKGWEDEVVTKTTAGLILLPADHYLVTRRDRPTDAMHRIGKSACDQCSYCTEFCPRYLLGYEVQPHKVMRSLGLAALNADMWNQWAQLCCNCGLCTLYACPEELYPKEACDRARDDMKSAGIKFVQQKEVRVHPMKEARRVPLTMLRKRLKVDEFESEAPYDARPHHPKHVRLPLSQHVGKPATPLVKPGARVKRGAKLAHVADADLGADLHASIGGTVAAVTDTHIEIEGA